MIPPVIAGRYKLAELLGEGGQSWVYRAYDSKKASQLYAVKILKPRIATDPDAPKRFINEVQITQQLNHSHIVRVHSSGVTDCGLSYLVMDFLSQGSLRDLLNSRDQQKLPFMRTLSIIRKVASGLAHAHQRGIVHRDLKPENILL